MKNKKVKLTITVSPEVIREFKEKCVKERRSVSKMIDAFMSYDVKSQISTNKILSLL
jgi:plasmid rolling circle replication initiator protein Rep